MPRQAWQAERAKLRPERARWPAVAPGVPCAPCGHPRSSHSMLIMYAPCRAEGCDCQHYDATCGCGHLLVDHTWGEPRAGWPCGLLGCACRGFGPKTEQLALM